MAAAGIELIWPGKDANDALDEACPELAALPLIERIGKGDTGLLLHGDNLLAMKTVATHYAGAIDLIYIDPPFATGLSYYSQRRVGADQQAGRAHSTQAGVYPP